MYAHRWQLSLATAILLILSPSTGRSAGKKVVLLAGRRSHGYGTHEHYAGCSLLARWLKANVPGVEALVHRGWPKNPAILEGAAAIAVICDGGGGHVLTKHLDEAGELMEQGVGLACIHYAVVVPKGAVGAKFLDWMGGHYETWWSVNPTWMANFREFREHPVTRGVRPFKIRDEWYYHMRFRESLEGVTPVLTAIPPDATRKRKDGAHSGNPHVRARMGQPEHVAWVYQRPNGGRGFGFTGGHWHWNWAHDDFRKLVLNALVWVAGLDVPAGGVESRTPTVADLQVDMDAAPPKNWQPQRIESMIRQFGSSVGR